MEAEQQQGQKTVVAFISGLLIGGLLMWVFGAEPKKEGAEEVKNVDTAAKNIDAEVEGATDENVTEDADAPMAPVASGDVSIKIAGAAAGANKVSLGDVAYPSDAGWIAVHRMDGENLGGVIGAARYGLAEGLTPTEIELYNATLEAGAAYAVVFHSTDGNRTYSSKTDAIMMNDAGAYLGSSFKAE